jgi:hypothetical protein
MKRMFQTTVLLALCMTAQATLYTTAWTNGVATFANGGVVPDNNYSGWTDTRTISTASAGTIQSLAVDLTLSGGWNGDLYAYLVNNTGGFSVLLDRIGTDPFGNSNPGMTVTLTTEASLFGANQGSIAALNGIPTGSWTPDITAGSWASLLGNTANGSTWTLYIADLNAGDVTTVQNWGLQMDIAAVPEPTTLAGMIFGAGLGILWLARSTPARRRLNQWKAALNQWLDAA